MVLDKISDVVSYKYILFLIVRIKNVRSEKNMIANFLRYSITILILFIIICCSLPPPPFPSFPSPPLLKVIVHLL